MHTHTLHQPAFFSPDLEGGKTLRSNFWPIRRTAFGEERPGAPKFAYNFSVSSDETERPPDSRYLFTCESGLRQGGK